MYIYIYIHTQPDLVTFLIVDSGGGGGGGGRRGGGEPEQLVHTYECEHV